MGINLISQSNWLLSLLSGGVSSLLPFVLSKILFFASQVEKGVCAEEKRNGDAGVYLKTVAKIKVIFTVDEDIYSDTFRPGSFIFLRHDSTKVMVHGVKL